MPNFNVFGFLLKKISNDSWKTLTPILKGANPELIRKVQIWLLKEGVFFEKQERDDPILAVSVWNRKFPNPIGVAAGYDPNAKVIDNMSDIGFGFGEVGTITLEQEKITRKVVDLKEDAAIMDLTIGFPNVGSKEVVGRLTARRGRRNIVGVSVGEGAIFEVDSKGNYIKKEDPIDQYEKALKAVAPVCDYVTINISAVNLGTLLEFQIEDSLNKLLSRMRKAIDIVAPINKPALLLKISADINDEIKAMIAKSVLANKVDGLVIAGGTKRPIEGLTSKNLKANPRGSISGKPIFDYSTQLIKEMYYHTQGQIPIIGVGGVFSGKDAYLKIRAGASLVQLYSSIIYEGPYIARTVKKELLDLLKADGFKSVKDAVGADMK